MHWCTKTANRPYTGAQRLQIDIHWCTKTANRPYTGAGWSGLLPFAYDALMHEKGPYAVCGQCRPRSACANAQADKSLHCPLTESMDTVVYVDEQRMSRSDCTDVCIWHKSLFPTLRINYENGCFTISWPLPVFFFFFFFFCFRSIYWHYLF